MRLTKSGIPRMPFFKTDNNILTIVNYINSRKFDDLMGINAEGYEKILERIIKYLEKDHIGDRDTDLIVAIFGNRRFANRIHHIRPIHYELADMMSPYLAEKFMKCPDVAETRVENTQRVGTVYLEDKNGTVYQEGACLRRPYSV